MYVVSNCVGSEVVTRATVSSGEGRRTISCDTYQELCYPPLDGLLTHLQIHSVGPGEIEQVGPDEVKAIFTVIYHAGPKGSTDPKGHGTGGGHYHETWKRQGDDWFLADLWFRRLYWIVRD